MKGTGLALGTMLLLALAAWALEVPVEVKITTVQDAQLSDFEAQVVENGPVRAAFSLKNTGNSFLEVTGALYAEQPGKKTKVSLPAGNLEIKEEKSFEGYIDPLGFREGELKLTLLVEARSKAGNQALREETTVMLGPEDLKEKNNRIVLSPSGEITGTGGSRVKGTLRVWNDSDQPQRLHLFATERQDLFPSQQVFLEPKTRKSIPVEVTIPEEEGDVNIMALSSGQRSNVLPLPIKKIRPSSEILALLPDVLPLFLGWMTLIVMLFVLAMGLVYVRLRNHTEKAFERRMRVFEKALGGEKREQGKEKDNRRTGDKKSKNAGNMEKQAEKVDVKLDPAHLDRVEQGLLGLRD